MAPRVRVNMVSDDADHSYPESSPDPLAMSVNSNKESKPERKSSRAAKAPLASSSPNKQARRPSITEQLLEFSSPSKSMVMNTGRPGGASPWRIKVTVEAEPGSGSENGNMESPTVKHVTRTRTKTTTVPLKDADDASPVKRRGRPRKSETTASLKPKSKRSGTPVRRRSKPRKLDVGAADISAADSLTDAAPNKRRGRPRKSVQPKRDETFFVNEQPLQSQLEPPTAQIPPTRSEEPESEPQEEAPAISTIRATRQDSTPQLEIPIVQTTRASPQEPQPKPDPNPTLKIPHFLALKTTLAPRSRGTPAPEEYNEPTVSIPRTTELSDKIRARRSTPAAKGRVILEDSSDDENAGVHTPSGTDEEGAATDSHEVANRKQATRQHKSSMLVREQEFDDDDDDDDEQFNDMTIYAFGEGNTKMLDDTTVLESENFSMVSVDSLPSGKGLSSLIEEQLDYTKPAAKSYHSILNESQVQLPLAAPRHFRSSPLPQRGASPGPSSTALRPQARSSSFGPPPRYHTPTVESRSPSNPPAIEPSQLSLKDAETPKLAKVVKAGIALQGLLDPARITPKEESSEQALGKRKDRLDDLFRGFSEGTRRELQAGLRLGEQLARQSQERDVKRGSSPALPTPSKTLLSGDAQDDVFKPSSKHRQSRLLTPEDQGDYTLPLPLPTKDADIEYPSLRVTAHYSHLVSPARSEDEMSWRVDTPPARLGSSGCKHLLTTSNEEGKLHHGQSVLAVPGEPQEEDYSDVWQEEASRSPDLPSYNDGSPEYESENTPQLQDLFTNDDSLVKPARSKIPKTWRRTSSSDFNYSDEADEEISYSPVAREQEEHPAAKPVDESKEKPLELAIPKKQEVEDEGNYSEASDDTGMFFQCNLPNIFKKKSETRLRDTRGGKVDLSLLLGEGDSLVPESSPAVKSPQPIQRNIFKNVPSHFTGFQASPARSSPLRYEMEIQGPEQSYDQSIDRSAFQPSSPFRTQVDDTMGSDVQQLRQEMEGHTDSSLRHLREEADAHAHAYEPQDRTLHEIEEVTEPSHTQATEMLPLSPPQAIEGSVLVPKRVYPPLFGDAKSAAVSRGHSPTRRTVRKPVETKIYKSIETPTVSVSPTVEEGPIGIFNRLTSTLWSALGAPAPPPPHPAAAKFDPLPKVEPWTKTHYKTLDALYQLHKNQPTLFAPASTNTSNTNNTVLTSFLTTNKQYPFIGARFCSWGYSVRMTEPLIVLCAVFMQLLKLNDIAEYERATGKNIELGDCNPGDSGTGIDALCVATRLASVVMGEALRRDEKRGQKVRREGAAETFTGMEGMEELCLYNTYLLRSLGAGGKMGVGAVLGSRVK
ncbi:uncharacterized protein BDR25DRAFT_396178 [Lindgomyces ingoldianus]|uniref:Uncharacterized protein n=1 Tax=Lindgomyces ingoldianus TaxID=673940 RepID=A0ACB6QF05_9PLEO|nr:uncharacterized protein BDR25DRAFT_396178 [Lindgomyces ingoldianus]KAF2465476.1 hypothetical protein BDR25DRAFT_396178 [Lindgomyces ingoldianus]